MKRLSLAIIALLLHGAVSAQDNIITVDAIMHAKAPVDEQITHLCSVAPCYL